MFLSHPTTWRCIQSGKRRRRAAWLIVLTVASSHTLAAEVVSGGLGLSRNAWETKHGKADSQCPGGLPYTCYERGKHWVSYMSNYIWLMEVYVVPLPYTSKTRGIGIEESRSLSKQYVPADGRLVKTYRNESGSTIDLYMSESLKSLASVLPARGLNIWSGGEVGNFIVIHSSGDSVTRIVIGTGNNP